MSSMIQGRPASTVISGHLRAWQSAACDSGWIETAGGSFSIVYVRSGSVVFPSARVPSQAGDPPSREVD